MIELKAHDKFYGRVLFEEHFPEFTENMHETEENGSFLVVAENTEGRVAKAKFRREWSPTGVFLMMYDAFFGTYIKSILVG